jgi:hypothetical protein
MRASVVRAAKPAGSCRRYLSRTTGRLSDVQFRIPSVIPSKPKYPLKDFERQSPVTALRKPGIELLDTGARSEILTHPGHGFLASIGCINLTSTLADGLDDIPFEDSRDRVIAAIDDLRAYLSEHFPSHGGRAIPKARIVIEDGN